LVLPITSVRDFQVIHVCLHALQYNGCKWRGLKLRVEVAKPDYLTRLQQERQEEQQQEQAKQEQQLQEQQQDAQQLPGGQQALESDAAAEAQQDTVIRLAVPGSRSKVS
jgi:hypothetical protein